MSQGSFATGAPPMLALLQIHLLRTAGSAVSATAGHGLGYVHVEICGTEKALQAPRKRLTPKKRPFLRGALSTAKAMQLQEYFEAGPWAHILHRECGSWHQNPMRTPGSLCFDGEWRGTSAVHPLCGSVRGAGGSRRDGYTSSDDHHLGFFRGDGGNSRAPKWHSVPQS